MRHLAAMVAILVLSGCDGDNDLVRNGTNSGAADSNASQAPLSPQSDTLKITYSKADPFEKSQSAPKNAAPAPNVHDGAGHQSKEKPIQEKKPTHGEHQKK